MQRHNALEFSEESTNILTQVHFQQTDVQYRFNFFQHSVLDVNIFKDSLNHHVEFVEIVIIERTIKVGKDGIRLKSVTMD
jgi:hypothetical protein